MFFYNNLHDRIKIPTSNTLFLVGIFNTKPYSISQTAHLIVYFATISEHFIASLF